MPIFLFNIAIKKTIKEATAQNDYFTRDYFETHYWKTTKANFFVV